MAKKRSRRGSRIRVARFAADLTLAALAAGDMISLNDLVANNGGQRVFAVSMDVTTTIRAATPGEGPVQVGVAHGDYTAAEIEEWYESQAGMDPTDKVAQEKNGRLCRDIGQFSLVGANEVLNNGNLKRVKLGFLLEDSKGIDAWAHTSTLLTTGAVVNFSGKLYYRNA